MNEARGELRPTDAKGIGCAAREGNYGREGSRFDVHIRIGKSSLSENIPPKVVSSQFAGVQDANAILYDKESNRHRKREEE